MQFECEFLCDHSSGHQKTGPAHLGRGGAGPCPLMRQMLKYIIMTREKMYRPMGCQWCPFLILICQNCLMANPPMANTLEKGPTPWTTCQSNANCALLPKCLDSRKWGSGEMKTSQPHLLWAFSIGHSWGLNEVTTCFHKSREQFLKLVQYGP